MSIKFTRASSQYCYVSDDIGITGLPLTFFCWAYKTSDTNTRGVLFTHRNDTADSKRFQFQQYSDVNVVRFHSNQQFVRNADLSQDPLNTWCGWIGQINTTDYYPYLYTSVGNASVSSTVAYQTNDAPRLYIGSTDTPDVYWDGYIEHFAVWNIALSSDDRTALLTNKANPLTVQPDNLVAYWPFTDSGSLFDDVAHETTLTLTPSASAPVYDATSAGVDPPPSTGPDINYDYNLVIS